MMTAFCVSLCVCRFYEYGLLPGVHFVTVDTAADVPAMVKYLREHDDYARAVALAGRARMAALDTDAVADFMAELLKQYAAKQVCSALSAACTDRNRLAHAALHPLIYVSTLLIPRTGLPARRAAERHGRDPMRGRPMAPLRERSLLVEIVHNGG